MLSRTGTYSGGSRLSRSISGMFGRRTAGGGDVCRVPRHAPPADTSLGQKKVVPRITEEPQQPGEGRVVKKMVVKAGSYDGELKDGLRHGKGVYKWSCGQQYQGDWEHDMRSGQGTETWPDGRKYQGQWVNDMFDGEGVWTWADGRVFQGTFQEYCPIQGKLFMPDGTLFEVKYDGDQPVFNGSTPAPIELNTVSDQAVVEECYEKMYEELCQGTVFTSIMRENWYRQDASGAVSMGATRQLRIDEVFMEHDENEGPYTAGRRRSQIEVRVSLDIRRSGDMQRTARRSADMQRNQEHKEIPDAEPRMSVEMNHLENKPTFDVQNFRRSVEYARKSISKEVARTSTDIVRRISAEIQRMTAPVPVGGPEAKGLLRNMDDLQDHDGHLSENHLEGQRMHQPRMQAVC